MNPPPSWTNCAAILKPIRCLYRLLPKANTEGFFLNVFPVRAPRPSALTLIQILFKDEYLNQFALKLIYLLNQARVLVTSRCGDRCLLKSHQERDSVYSFDGEWCIVGLVVYLSSPVFVPISVLIISVFFPPFVWFRFYFIFLQLFSFATFYPFISLFSVLSFLFAFPVLQLPTFLHPSSLFMLLLSFTHPSLFLFSFTFISHLPSIMFLFSHSFFCQSSHFSFPPHSSSPTSPSSPFLYNSNLHLMFLHLFRLSCHSSSSLPPPSQTPSFFPPSFSRSGMRSCAPVSSLRTQTFFLFQSRSLSL